MLYIITPISREYIQYLPELRQNIRAMVQVPYKLVIAGNTLLPIKSEGDNEIIIDYGKNLGIFAAKYATFNTLYKDGRLTSDDWVTFIDADDFYQTAITAELLPDNAEPILYFDAFGANVKFVSDCKKMFTWCFAFRPIILSDAYRLIEEAAEKMAIDLCLTTINSCEDMLLMATLRRHKVTSVPIDTICHTENDASATNSTAYTYEKIINLFGSWSSLLSIACRLMYGRQWLISTMRNCFTQYWYNYRQWLPIDDREKCDAYIRELEKL